MDYASRKEEYFLLHSCAHIRYNNRPTASVAISIVQHSVDVLMIF